MKIIEEKDDYDPDDIMLIESLSYYKLEFLNYDWILKTLCGARVLRQSRLPCLEESQGAGHIGRLQCGVDQ